MSHARLTRRQFLKTSSALAASLALTLTVPRQADAAGLIDPYNGSVPLWFPLRGVRYHIDYNWHVPRVGSILPIHHQIRSSLRAHDGVDIFAARGTPLYACTTGTVVEYPRPRYLYGNYVWIQSAAGYRFFYCHLDKVHVRVGQSVDANTVVGTVGNTGNAVGLPSHLHFELHFPPGNVYSCRYCAPRKVVSSLNPTASLRAASARALAPSPAANARATPHLS